MSDFFENETRKLSHVVLVISITVFSIVLISLNFRKGWEKWIIPVLCVVIAAVFFMHITGRPGEKERIYTYSSILCLELFYYILNIDIIYNTAPVAMLTVVLLSMPGERRLITSAALAGTVGLLLRFFSVDTPGRIVWHTILIWITAFVCINVFNEIKKMESSYRKFVDGLKQQNKSADDFLANVSHEIRTPVNAVIGLTGVCLEKEKDPEITGNLKMVSEAGHRLSEQISDILDYSEIEREALAVNPEDYRLATLVKDLTRELDIYKDSEVELIMDIDPEVPSVMRTDTLKLKRILWHVITNGFKYTARGGVYVHISAAPQRYGTNLRIDVTDTGIGMTEDEREKIYEHFYQSDSGRSRTGSGLGLGMSIAKGFTEALEGFITVNSNPSGGTHVRICIPQAVANDNPCMALYDRDNKVIGGFFTFEKIEEPFVRDAYNRLISDTVKGLKTTMHRVDNLKNLRVLKESLNMTHLFVGENEYRSDPVYMESLAEQMKVILVCDSSFIPDSASKVKILRKPLCSFDVVELLNSDGGSADDEENRMYCKGVKILVVDDEAMNLMVAKSILSRYGIKVTTAASGVEAIDCCMRDDFDLIFMDYMMPRMDGIETARKIRAIRKDGNVPKMVAFTANAVSTAKEIFVNEGFSAFLSKPIELNELKRVLKSLLSDSVISYRKVMADEDEEKDAPADETAQSEEEGAPETEEYEDFVRLEKQGINTAKGMDYCLKDREMYISVLEEYQKDAAVKIVDMNKFYSGEEWDEFVIRIHSVKSSSLMIGAERLSKKAKMIEDAAKDRDLQLVHEAFPEFLPEYEAVVQVIREVYGHS
ncbi:MAG: response regulator [Lachnospiraceae bacterium]|nr:response regulator [Lachnospiraceae bacterium]